MIAMQATTPTTQPVTTPATLDEELSDPLPVCALSLTLEEVTVVGVITDVTLEEESSLSPVH